MITATRPPVVTGRCQHQPPCPDASATDREAARRIDGQPSQGWSLLCNGVVLFDDGGELLPDNTALPAHRGPAKHTTTACV